MSAAALTHSFNSSNVMTTFLFAWSYSMDVILPLQKSFVVVVKVSIHILLIGANYQKRQSPIWWDRTSSRCSWGISATYALKCVGMGFRTTEKMTVLWTRLELFSRLASLLHWCRVPLSCFLQRWAVRNLSRDFAHNNRTMATRNEIILNTSAYLTKNYFSPIRYAISWYRFVITAGNN